MQLKYLLAILYLCFGLALISSTALAQWIIPYGMNRDVTSSSLFIIQINPEKVDQNQAKGFMPVKIVKPIFHYLIPLVAFLSSFLVASIVSFMEKKYLNQRIVPFSASLISAVVIFSMIVLIAQILTVTYKIEGLAYGQLPMVFHIILFVIIAFILSTDFWSFYQKIWAKMKITQERDVILEFRDYMQKTLRLITRITLVLLVSVSLGAWSILKGFHNLDNSIQNYQLLALLINFFVCIIPIIVWLIYPLFTLLEKSEFLYFKVVAKNDHQSFRYRMRAKRTQQNKYG